MKTRNITNDEYVNIAKLYESGLSQQKIADKYKTSVSTISKILKYMNVKIRDNSHKSRKYIIKDNYFDNIDTPEKAYILGLMYADGCNYTPLHHVFIELQERDKSILDKINIEIGSNRPLTFNNLNAKNDNWQNTYRLSIGNKHISETLEQHGLVRNKSLVITFPVWLDESLYSHFIRGYFDGDGHIEWNNIYFLTFAGTKQFCEKLKEIFENKFNASCSISNTANKASNVKVLYVYGKKTICDVLHYMYHDTYLHIERKYEKYLQIYNEMKHS